jgi:regulator of sigma E protease
MQILSGVLLLAILIVFHELGHFLLAKMLGVRVLVFSVGFGPRLLGFTYKGTEYRLSAIPLGGYVRLFGESLEGDYSEEEKKWSFMHQAIWRKSLIAVAGPVFNFILPVILLFAMLIGVEQVYLAKIGTILDNSPAQKAGLLPDDRILSVNNLKVETFSDLAEKIAHNPDTQLALEVSRKSPSGQEEILTIQLTPEAKPAHNPLEKNKKVGRIGIMPAIALPTILIYPHSPLLKAGLENFDQIIAINDESINSAFALENALPKLHSGAHIKVLRTRDEKSETLNFTIQELALLKQDYNITIKPDIDADLIASDLVKKSKSMLFDAQKSFSPLGLSLAEAVITSISVDSVADNLGLKLGSRLIALDGEAILGEGRLQEMLLGDLKASHVLAALSPTGEPQIFLFNMPEATEKKLGLDANLYEIFGVKLKENYKAGEPITRVVGIKEAFVRSCSQTYAIGAMTLKSLWLFVSGEVAPSQLSGPIMIFDIAHQAAQKGLHYYLFIMCLLSVNLGLLNLLPVPALDGGHLLLFGIEAIQRKPLSQRTRAVATQIGFALLLCLMAFAIFNDLVRVFR